MTRLSQSDLAQRADRGARRLGDAAALFVELLSAFRRRLHSTIVCRCCWRMLPYFLVFSVVVCYACKLTTTKWRFISLPDALNILKVAAILTLGAGGAGLCVRLSPNLRHLLRWPHHRHPVFLSGSVFLSALRFAYRYFRYSRVRHHARRRKTRRRPF